MKKYLVALALALSVSLGGAAAPFENMYQECARQMAQGSCVALADPGSFTQKQLDSEVVLLMKGGPVRVKFKEYLDVRGIGSVDPSDLRMCEVARQYCLANEEDGRCKVGKALWGS